MALLRSGQWVLFAVFGACNVHGLPANSMQRTTLLKWRGFVWTEVSRLSGLQEGYRISFGCFLPRIGKHESLETRSRGPVTQNAGAD